MSKILFLMAALACLLCSELSSVDVTRTDPKLNDSVNSWISLYISPTNGSLSCSKKDLQIILNLLYLSYERSFTTLVAQEKALASLDVVWHVFHNILKTRRNPSKEIAQSISREAFIQSMKTLFDMQEMHLHIGTAYAKALDLVMNGSLVSDKTLVEGIKALRKQSRVAIVHSLTDVNEYVDALLHTRSNNIDEQVKAMVNYVDEYSCDVKRNLLIADYLWGLVPYLAVNSFVKADNLTVMMSEQWWKTLMQMISISNFIWRSVETARATLYLEYYKALYALAVNNDCNDCLAVMFDEQGVITNPTERSMLPQPQKLPSSFSTDSSVTYA